MRAPLIIIGMHRSGTSYVAQVLHHAGIFMGVFKDHHFEAAHFRSLNQQLLQGQGASWLYPEPIAARREVSLSANELYSEHFQCNSRLQRLQLAWQKPDWGWKDPRNTFTLPVWLRCYPGARVLHLTRNIDEIARSLQRRNGRAGEGYYQELESRDFCKELATQYQKQGHSYAATLGKRYLQVDYARLYNLEPLALQQMEEFTGKSLRHIFEKLRR